MSKTLHQVTGSHDRQANVTIEFNSQCSKLEGPNGGRYLPCDICGKVAEVKMNVVAFMCGECAEKVNNGEMVP